MMCAGNVTARDCWLGVRPVRAYVETWYKMGVGWSLLTLLT